MTRDERERERERERDGKCGARETREEMRKIMNNVINRSKKKIND